MDSKHLERRTLGRLQNELGPKGRYLLAVSGGVDSVVMLEVLSRLKNSLGWNMTVIHVHHGSTKNTVQQNFRDQAQKLVEKLALEKGLPFLTNVKSDSEGETSDSEEGLRRFRYNFFNQWSVQYSNAPILLAHQSQDWLESQLMMLIRGTGTISENFQEFVRFRPLEDWSKEEILFYAKGEKLNWLEDPSNEQLGAFRNWLRQEWLPQLESYRQGNLQSFARSLNLLWSQKSTAQDLFNSTRLWLSSQEVSRREFTQLSLADQGRVLATMMNNSGVRNYTSAHIKEVLKRLDTDQKDLSFTTAKALWSASPDVIKIHLDSRPDGSF